MSNEASMRVGENLIPAGTAGQTWFAMDEESMSLPQSEHFIVGIWLARRGGKSSMLLISLKLCSTTRDPALPRKAPPVSTHRPWMIGSGSGSDKAVSDRRNTRLVGS